MSPSTPALHPALQQVRIRSSALNLACVAGLLSAALLSPTVYAASHSGAPAAPKPAAAPAAPAASAPGGTCQQQATDRKLAGAAKNAFLTKCEREATERCEAAANDKKLAGAARTANINKCLKDTVGER